MVVVPCATPVTTPVLEFTVATPGVLLLQVPPASPLAFKLMLALAHTEVKPLMVPALGSEFTKIVTPEEEEPQLFVTL